MAVGNRDTKQKWGSIFDFLAGTADAAGGICEVSGVGKTLAIHLEVASSTFSIAAYFARNRNWLGVGITFLVGGLVQVLLIKFIRKVLKKVFEELMKLVFKAF